MNFVIRAAVFCVIGIGCLQGQEELPYISGFTPRNHVLHVRDTDEQAAAIPALFGRSVIPSGPLVNRLARADEVPKAFQGAYFPGMTNQSQPISYADTAAFSVGREAIEITTSRGPLLFRLRSIQAVREGDEDLALLVAHERVTLGMLTVLLRRVTADEVVAYEIDDTFPGKKPFMTVFYRIIRR